ncbi:hypothetical protein [Actinomadura sp. J1-007]|uniref:hypothetical protein n=1 Tax=Actinomadura sp. J1-007 TaxID=2661913 RepID=UPI001F4F7635|nr:hypothetical protein [Actinomadura sp. J1-007]
MSTARQDHRLVRHDDHWLSLPNDRDVPVGICAGADVPLEPSAVDEALSVLETADTLRRLAEATPGYDGPSPGSPASRSRPTCTRAPGSRSGR